MKIYSDTLTSSDVQMAVTEVNSARIGAHIGFETFEPMTSPRLRARGWNIRLYRIGSNRRFNPGKGGTVPETGAASWDDWGDFLAALYERDPAMRAGEYISRANFHASTRHAYGPDRLASTS